MPSPIAHLAAGYALYEGAAAYKPGWRQRRIFMVPLLLAATGVLSLLPDLDVIPGVLFGELNRYHNNLTHSLLVGLLVALLVGGGVWLKQRAHFWTWFWLTLLGYTSHVLMDYFCFGRGTMLFWPLSAERYEPPFLLFYGLRRDDGLLSMHHVWTILNEVGFALIVIIGSRLWFNRRRGGVPTEGPAAVSTNPN